MTNLSDRINIRCRPDTRRKLATVCEYYDLTLSEFLRRVVTQQYDFIAGQDPEGVQNVEKESAG